MPKKRIPQRQRLITFDELRDYGVPHNRRHIYDLEIAGKFPKRVPIGENRIAWVEDEILKYVDQRVEARHPAKFGTLGSRGIVRFRGQPAKDLTLGDSSQALPNIVFGIEELDK